MSRSKKSKSIPAPTPEEVEQLRLEYEEARPRGEKLAVQLSKELTEILTRGRVPLAVPVQYRVKEWSSLEFKILNGGLGLKSVLKFQDLVGLRIILLFQRDVAKARDLISQNFTIQSAIDKTESLKENQFGYLSFHFVVSIPDEWLSLPTFHGMNDFIAEIQIRTVAQHTWAAASHVLQYKQEDQIPKELVRSINRMAALLEVVDNEFERVLAERDRYRNTIDVTIDTQELNVDVLRESIANLVPSPSRLPGEDYGNVLEILRFFGINTISTLKKLVEVQLSEALKDEAEEVNRADQSMGVEGIITGVDSDKLEQGVYYTYTGLIRRMLRHADNDKFVQYMLDTLHDSNA